jgi:MFS family permease
LQKNKNRRHILVQSKVGGWYFGWNIVAGGSLLTLLTVGMRMGIGPFFLPIAEDLGFSRSLLAGIVAIGMLCYGLAMPLGGYLVAKRGTKFVLLLGVTIVVAASIWSTYARTPWSFFLAFGVFLSLGLAFTSPVAVTPVISRWFTRQRGMALFFLSTGSMAGIAVMTPVLTTAIHHYGWQATLLGYAIAFAVIAVPIAVFVMRDAAPLGTDTLNSNAAATAVPNAITTSVIESQESSVTLVRKGVSAPSASALTSGVTTSSTNEYAEHIAAMTFGQAIRTVPFWKICLGLFTCGFSMNLLGTHGMPMLMDHGFDATTSSFGIGLIGLVAIFSTLVLGRLADKIPRRYILSTIYLIRGLGFFALLIVGTHFELYVAAAIGGIVWAGSIAMSSAILADLYGIRLVGILYGWTYLSHQVGAMISSWLGGWAYEAYGTHWVAFGSAGILLLMAALLSLTLPSKLK